MYHYLIYYVLCLLFIVWPPGENVKDYEGRIFVCFIYCFISSAGNYTWNIEDTLQIFIQKWMNNFIGGGVVS